MHSKHLTMAHEDTRDLPLIRLGEVLHGTPGAWREFLPHSIRINVMQRNAMQTARRIRRDFNAALVWDPTDGTHACTNETGTPG